MVSTSLLRYYFSFACRNDAASALTLLHWNAEASEEHTIVIASPPSPFARVPSTCLLFNTQWLVSRKFFYKPLVLRQSIRFKIVPNAILSMKSLRSLCSPFRWFLTLLQQTFVLGLVIVPIRLLLIILLLLVAGFISWTRVRSLTKEQIQAVPLGVTWQLKALQYYSQSHIPKNRHIIKLQPPPAHASALTHRCSMFLHFAVGHAFSWI